MHLELDEKDRLRSVRLVRRSGGSQQHPRRSSRSRNNDLMYFATFSQSLGDRWSCDSARPLNVLRDLPSTQFPAVSCHYYLQDCATTATVILVQLSIRCHDSVMRRGMLKVIGTRMTLPDGQEHTQTPFPSFVVRVC